MEDICLLPVLVLLVWAQWQEFNPILSWIPSWTGLNIFQSRQKLISSPSQSLSQLPSPLSLSSTSPHWPGLSPGQTTTSWWNFSNLYWTWRGSDWTTGIKPLTTHSSTASFPSLQWETSSLKKLYVDQWRKRKHQDISSLYNVFYFWLTRSTKSICLGNHRWRTPWGRTSRGTASAVKPCICDVLQIEVSFVSKRHLHYRTVYVININ